MATLECDLRVSCWRVTARIPRRSFCGQARRVIQEASQKALRCSECPQCATTRSRPRCRSAFVWLGCSACSAMHCDGNQTIKLGYFTRWVVLTKVVTTARAEARGQSAEARRRDDGGRVCSEYVARSWASAFRICTPIHRAVACLRSQLRIRRRGSHWTRRVSEAKRAAG